MDGSDKWGMTAQVQAIESNTKAEPIETYEDQANHHLEVFEDSMPFLQNWILFVHCNIRFV